MVTDPVSVQGTVEGPFIRHRTLFLTGWLHVFTHIYHVALLPLYLPMVRDLGLTGVDQATLLVTAMMVAYFVPSYFMGTLADRWNRRYLLAGGLLINALGFMGLAYAENYGTALFSMAVCGLGGSCFHPAATALVVGLYPQHAGRALGWLGMGASMGFFIGPFYSGWRADHSGWRQAVLELGWAGVVMALIFAWLAVDAERDRESRAQSVRDVAKPEKTRRTVREPMFIHSLGLWAFLLTALLVTLRDFGGAGTGTLTSLYLQKAHGESLEGAGRVLGLMFLASAISNPLVGYLSDRARLRWAGGLLFLSALLLACLPWVSRPMFPWLLMCFGFFFMASYPVVEASLMIAVPASTRGRAFGLFITFGGLLGNLSHWGIGHWVQRLGDAAWEVATYKPLFGGLAVLMGTSILALPLIRYLQVQLEKRQRPGLPVGIGLDPSFARVHATGLQSDSKNTLGSTAVSTVDTTHERNVSP